MIFIGFMKNVKILNKIFINNFAILLGANLIIYMSGAAYIAFLTKGSFLLVLAGFALYLIGDLFKITAVIYVYSRIRDAITYEWL